MDHLSSRKCFTKLTYCPENLHLEVVRVASNNVFILFESHNATMASNDPEIVIVSHYLDDIVVQSNNTQLARQIADSLAEERQQQLQQRRQRWRTEQQQLQQQIQQQRQLLQIDQAVWLCALMVFEDNPGESVEHRINEVTTRLQRDGVQFNQDRYEPDLRRFFEGSLQEAYEFVFESGRVRQGSIRI